MEREMNGIEIHFWLDTTIENDHALRAGPSSQGTNAWSAGLQGRTEGSQERPFFHFEDVFLLGQLGHVVLHNEDSPAEVTVHSSVRFQALVQLPYAVVVASLTIFPH
eukprot:TRINITY_DN34788_c0_g1_i1.p2 TRINITY_DN34788_c0_g1~~TRINITY_DN34788_c0_g1_i1.p2  ORF type:complete len:107 (+),score=15.47 TRINITY_DN34788_c0_g1_i1:648-968(+)